MSRSIMVHMLAFADKGDRSKIRMVELPKDFVGYELFDVLEEVFRCGQNDVQPQQMPSVSVGDVAEIGGRYFMVLGMGWKEISKDEFDALEVPTSQHAYLRSFEA